MFSAIRKRLSYANVAVTLALVFAMTGGAYAANKYLITSTKQISPKVLRALKGKPGANGTNGAQGPAGPAGATGPGGPQGPVGAAGAKGETGTAGAPGKEGKEGKTGFTKTLPEGATETGDFVTLGTEAGADFAALSFAIPLAAPLNGEHTLVASSANKEKCPGTAEEPEAEPGYLCVYMVLGTAVNTVNPSNSESGAATSGTLLETEGKFGTFSKGTYAVTG
jgi:hypothetical protein